MNNTQVNKTIEDRGVHKFDQGSVLSVLLKTALPIVILMLFNSLYAFVDSLMSSTYVSYGEHNGVALNGGTSFGLIMPLMGLLIASEVMIAVGVGLAYTQSMAQKNYDEARERHNEAMSMIIYMGIFISLVTSIIGIPYILTASGNWNGEHWGIHTHKMVIDAYAYMMILTLAFIPMQLQQSYIRVLRSEGKGDAAAVIPILTMPINVFFDWLFMHVIGTGLFGAGIATLIASSSGLLMMWVYISYQGLHDNLVIKWKAPTFRIQKEIAIIVMVFAMGSFLRRVFDSSTMIVMSSYVGNIHPDKSGIAVPHWTGSWTVMTRSINMGSQLSLGVAQAMSMLISYYVGSKQNEKIGQTIKFGALSMVICSLFSVFVLFGLQGILFNAYDSTSAFGWKWFNSISMAYIIALLFSIPLSLQPMAVMFYAGNKRPKLTLYHSLTFNAILIASASIGAIINWFTGYPVILFISMFIGALIGFAVVSIMFKFRYKELMLNNI